MRSFSEKLGAVPAVYIPRASVLVFLLAVRGIELSAGHCRKGKQRVQGMFFMSDQRRSSCSTFVGW